MGWKISHEQGGAERHKLCDTAERCHQLNDQRENDKSVGAASAAKNNSSRLRG